MSWRVEKVFVLACDYCYAEFADRDEDKDKIINLAREAGWYYTFTHTYCGKCNADRIKDKGRGWEE